MERIDCLVAGAGPAGMAAAITLARAGARVAVVEKKERAGGKACGGGLTPRAVKLIRKLKFDAHLGHPVFYLEGNAPPHHYNCFTLKKPALHIARRALFDQSLRDAAQNMGINFVFGAISGASWDGRIFTLKTLCSKVLKSPRLIAADGAASRVRRSFGGTVSCQALALMADELETPGERPRILFDGGMVASGYGWVFPYGDGRANAGVYSVADISGAQMRLGLADYLKKRLAEDAPGKITGGAIPWGGYSLPGRAPLLLAGDAGGFADPMTGEGIYAALYTGHAAALAALGASPETARIFYEKSLRPLFANMALLRLICQRAYRLPRLGGRILGLKAVHGPITEGLIRGLNTSAVIGAFPALLLLSLANPSLSHFERRNRLPLDKASQY
ncbi:MAG: geranylgeranyl reductase family protein [Desulfatibacillaceae bacterium]|nr:geranylgeranyl reductase family protein [Desulfatibacillaceae bacterium]